MCTKGKTELVKCYKCDGKGRINYYAHIANGVCFLCKGSGVLPQRAKGNKGYSWDFVKSHYGFHIFPENVFFHADKNMEYLETIGNHGHETAEVKVYRDSDFYYVGQPVCGSSIWYAVPHVQWDEFKKHYNRVHKGKTKSITITV